MGCGVWGGYRNMRKMKLTPTPHLQAMTKVQTKTCKKGIKPALGALANTIDSSLTIDMSTGKPLDIPPEKKRRMRPLKTSEDVEREIRKVYRRMHFGEIAREDGTKDVYVLMQLLQAGDIRRQKKRIEALEARAALGYDGSASEVKDDTAE